MLNPWLALSFQTVQLAWEAQSVIALRLMRLAWGGTTAQTEARRIITEKIAAMAEAQAAAATVAMTGGNVQDVAGKVIKVYKKRVGRNKRRLLR